MANEVICAGGRAVGHPQIMCEGAVTSGEERLVAISEDILGIVVGWNDFVGPVSRPVGLPQGAIIVCVDAVKQNDIFCPHTIPASCWLRPHPQIRNLMWRPGETFWQTITSAPQGKRRSFPTDANAVWSVPRNSTKSCVPMIPLLPR